MAEDPTPAPILNNDPSTTSTSSSKSEEEERVFTQLTRIVEEYRGGKISRFQASADCLSELEKWTGVSDDSRERALNTCLEQLNTEQVNTSTEHIEGGNTSTFKGATGPTEKRRQEETLNIIETLAKGDEALFDGEDERPIGKRRLNEEDMPWFSARIVDARRPSCIKTSNILRTFAIDTSRSKALLRTAPNLPDGVPPSQWDRIVKGEPIDLNLFFAARHGIQLDTERKGRLGESEIVFAIPDSKRQIKTGSDWSAAFRRAKIAITFVFKHRREELEEYQEYIEKLFDAKQESAHARVI